MRGERADDIVDVIAIGLDMERGAIAEAARLHDISLRARAERIREHVACGRRIQSRNGEIERDAVACFAAARRAAVDHARKSDRVECADIHRWKPSGDGSLWRCPHSSAARLKAGLKKRAAV